MTDDKKDLIRQMTDSRASLLGYLRILVRDPHLAEDLFQETFLVVLEKINTFDADRDFGAWVRGIARNVARNMLRKNRRLHLMASDEIIEAIEASYQGVEKDIQDRQSDILEYLSVCIKKVRPKHRDLLKYRYRMGRSLKEIGDMLGQRTGAIQVALTRIRQTLLNCIKKEYAKNGQAA